MIEMMITLASLYVGYRLFRKSGEKWKIQCKLPPKTKRFCPLVLK